VKGRGGSTSSPYEVRLGGEGDEDKERRIEEPGGLRTRNCGGKGQELYSGVKK